MKDGSLLREKNTGTMIFILLYLAVAAMLFWRCRFGFPEVDEAFYLTIPYRLTLGDCLFTHEWHLSQMSGFILYPFVSFYLTVVGSTDGIILAARYLCAAVQCITALFVFFRFKRFSLWGAASAALCFMAYIPFYICALSYNSMGIILLVLSLTILTTAERHLPLQHVLSGIVFSLAALCNPYLIAVYFVYGLFAFVCRIIPSGRRSEAAKLSFRSFLFFSCGCVFMAVVFFAFILSRTGISRLLASLPALFTDPEHSEHSVFSKLCSYVYSIAAAGPHLVFFLYIITALLFFICLLDKKRAAHRSIFFLSAGFITVLLMLLHCRMNYINYLMWSVNVLAPFIFVLSNRKEIKKLFCLIWIPGILYSFCLHMSSNQLFYAISSASAVAAVGSLLMIFCFISELLKEDQGPVFKCALCLLAVFIFIFQLSSECAARYKNVYWNDVIEAQTVPVEEGICDGLIVTPAYREHYYRELNTLSVLENYSAEKVLYLSENTWYYLSNDHEFATYSAWLSGVNDITVQRLKLFYTLNPDKLPDLVFAEPKNRQYADSLCQFLSYKADVYDNCIVLRPAV